MSCRRRCLRHSRAGPEGLHLPGPGAVGQEGPWPVPERHRHCSPILLCPIGGAPGCEGCLAGGCQHSGHSLQGLLRSGTSHSLLCMSHLFSTTHWRSCPYHYLLSAGDTHVCCVHSRTAARPSGTAYKSCCRRIQQYSTKLYHYHKKKISPTSAQSAVLETF